MTHPHRWLRAAHKIAPNGALLPNTSYYRSDRTERSRPFLTNQLKVRNLPSKFIDRPNPLKQNVSAGFSLSFSSPLPRPSAKRPQSRCEKPFSHVRHLFPSALQRPSQPFFALLRHNRHSRIRLWLFAQRTSPCVLPVCKRPKSALFVCAALFLTLGQASRTEALSRLFARSRSSLPCR